MQMLKKHKWLLVSSGITLVILLLIFSLKGLYPFGENIFSVVDFDYAPIYYKFWDIVHGTGSILFDWNLGVGSNCYNSLLMNGLFYPTSWLILLFNRDFIVYGMNIIILIKILNMNVFTFIAIDKLFPKLEGYYKVVLSLFYTFSGWTLLMANSLLYLDAVSLFPLFVLAYYNFIKNDKWIPFVSILTIIFIISYYQTWIYLFFIIGITIITMLTMDVKNKKKKCIQILLMVLCSLAISMVSFLPSIYQVLTSYRVSSTPEGNATGLILFFNKLFYMLPLGVLFSIVYKQLTIKKDIKINIWFILMIIYTLSGLLIEPINKLWNTGSYYDFSFIYSYIPTFILIIISAHYLTNNLKYNKKRNIATLISTIIGIAMFIILFLLFKDEIAKSEIALSIYSYAQPIGLLVMFLVSVAVTFMIFSNDKKMFISLFCSFTLISITLFSYMYISINSNAVSVNSQKLRDKFNLINDGYNYIIDDNINPGDNFSYILKVPSIQNKLNFIKESEIDFRNAFNYGGIGSMAIKSSGGNLLSNYLIMNKYRITKNELPEKLYSKIKNEEDINYYESIYNLDYIIPYNGKIYNEITNFIDDTNNIYKIISNSKKNIMNRVNINSDNQYINFELKKDNIYYMEYKVYDYNSILDNIYNNKNIYISEGFVYKADGEQKTYLVLMVNENQKIKIKHKKYREDEFLLGYININKFIDFVSKRPKYEVSINTVNNSRTYDITLDEDKSVLVPINYDKDFKVLVNGVETSYVKNIYNMFSIDLKKGKNRIEFIYYPKYLKEGMAITFVTLLLLIGACLSNKKITYLLKRK